MLSNAVRRFLYVTPHSLMHIVKNETPHPQVDIIVCVNKYLF